MSQSYRQRIFTRQFIDTSDFTGLLNSVADTTAQNALGGRIFVKDPAGNNVGFVYAQVTTCTTPAIGVPAYWTDAAHTIVTDDPTKAYTYVASSEGAIFSAAGVFITTATTLGTYGWFQTSGYLSAVALSTVGTVATGDKLVLSNAAGTAPSVDLWTKVGVATAVATSESLTTLYLITVAGTTTCQAWIMGTCALA